LDKLKTATLEPDKDQKRFLLQTDARRRRKVAAFSSAR
jgi:hypothetical protein